MIDDILSAADGRVDEIELLLAEGHGIRADIRRGEITIGTASRSSSIIIRTIHNGRIGVSSCDSPARWKECLDAAIAGGGLADPQAWGGLPGPVHEMKEPLASDPALKVSPDLLTSLINTMIQGTKEYNATITSGSASLGSGHMTLANSAGLMISEPSTYASLSVEMIQGQSTGYEYDSSWKLDHIDPNAIGRTASWFAYAGQNGVELDSGTYPIVLSPDALSQLIDAVLVPALSGRNVHAGRSILADKIGEQVLGEELHLYDDPLDERGKANSYWDGEGVPVKRLDLITNGILNCFAYDLRTAYRYGEENTGNAVRAGAAGSPSIGFHNLVLKGPVGNVLDDKAIYIRDVVGAHTANPMSGDFSVELSSPFFAEEGELGTPIRSAMLSGNVFNLMRQVQCVSEETKTIGNMILPSVRIADQTLVGKI